MKLKTLARIESLPTQSSAFDRFRNIELCIPELTLLGKTEGTISSSLISINLRSSLPGIN
jgi:hypothetical protein